MWRKTTPSSARSHLPSANSLEDKPANNITESLTLLSAATTSKCDTYSYLSSAVAALTTEISFARKKLVASLK